MCGGRGGWVLKEWVMGVQEKQPFMTKAVQKKSEYDKTISAYNKKQVGWRRVEVYEGVFLGGGAVWREWV